ncbi:MULTISPECIES: aldo/keto reductase [unclassified Streptomyces]|uniref:aldo/keto reductase n=1 Tax=unclassified Streptomyces TaxID=2593676 RepID=UPI00224CDA6F|nr:MULTISPECIES: aldo/keto reductase [unclassified Streptomyces]MCX4788496.1 aldo/keto reductase [Streptomyces sp. NBC_01221]WSP56742.1 aldo/keto reductase [Streptomyces sp. NBC_01241]WSP63431.1 aldo/keto reductase [Streptomyces sp. NBC_01240]
MNGRSDPGTEALGHSRATVSRLGFGAAAIGNLFDPVSEEAAAAAVDAAWNEGFRYFDTAPHYGLGLSERRLGAALAGRPRASFTVSTKVGRLLEPLSHVQGDDLANGFAVPATHRRIWDFSADGVRRSIEDSLLRLGMDRIDVAYLHDPDDHAEQALEEAYPALERLRAEGVVAAIGVGMNQTGLLHRFVQDTDVDVVLLAGRYTLLDHGALDDLLPTALERSVAVVIGGVFNSGVLADPRPDATYAYAPVPPEILVRAMRIKEVCARHDVPLRGAALQFPFGHPAVASVLVGARSAAEVRDAARLLDRPAPAGLWPDLQASGLLPASVPTPKGS